MVVLWFQQWSDLSDLPLPGSDMNSLKHIVGYLKYHFNLMKTNDFYLQEDVKNFTVLVRIKGN